MEYLIHIVILINIYIIITSSTNLLVGVVNLLSMGQAAFYGLGAYFSVMALMTFHLSLFPTLLIAISLTAILSLIIAFPTLNLKGDYFVLATLGFQLIIYSILYNWISVTNGPFGIAGIPAPQLFRGIEISGLWAFLALSSMLASIVVFIVYQLLHSPFGRALRGIRDDELSMLALGKNVMKFKVQIFFISSGLIAVAGFLFATYVSYIDPTSFNLDESIFILTAVIVGGLGNVKGPIIGSLFVILLPEALRFLGMPDALAANMRQIIFGLSLVFLMYIRPKGLAGTYEIK
ncbi:MAG: branched-chain amino acid ABC transporter permease [Bacteroidales bacterium]